MTRLGVSVFSWSRRAISSPLTPGQVDVQDGDVRFLFLNQLQRQFAIAGFADQLKAPVVRDDLAQAFPEERVVVHNQNFGAVLHENAELRDARNSAAVLLPFGGNGNNNFEAGAFSGGGIEFERAAEDAGALGHVFQSHAFGLAVRTEPLAVVFNKQAHVAHVALEGDAGMFCAGMFEDIIYRLLGDAVKVGGGIARKNAFAAVEFCFSNAIWLALAAPSIRAVSAPVRPRWSN